MTSPSGDCSQSALCGGRATEKLTYYGSVTREPYEYQGRITHLIENGKFEDLHSP